MVILGAAIVAGAGANSTATQNNSKSFAIAN